MSKTPSTTPTTILLTLLDMSERKTPGEYVAKLTGRPVVVKLHSGVIFRGILACLDSFLNIALEQTEEYDAAGHLIAKHYDAFIRGNNVLYLAPAPSS